MDKSMESLCSMWQMLTKNHESHLFLSTITKCSCLQRSGGCEVLQGLGHIALVRLAAAIGGDGLRGGVLPGANYEEDRSQKKSIRKGERERDGTTTGLTGSSHRPVFLFFCRKLFVTQEQMWVITSCRLCHVRSM